MIIQSKVHDPPGTLGLEVYGSFGSLGGRVLVFFFFVLCFSASGFGVFRAWGFAALSLLLRGSGLLVYGCHVLPDLEAKSGLCPQGPEPEP